ncbi:MAG TPA: NmrA family NAD(P)-binding protein [Atribacteraceae bacterium]|nr:NmrA family NAD(P)-binding protein [Atribacteraceae bacterium]
MDSFAFIIHAFSAQDIKDHLKPLRLVPGRLVEALAARRKPFILSEVRGIVSQANGKEIKGWFVGLPMTSRVLLEYSDAYVARKIRECGRLAEEYGAKVIGLGAFTSVAGDGGITAKQGLNINVTTGNSYTVATALEALRIACPKVDIDLDRETIAVVGATGSIGRACALVLARGGKTVRVVGRDWEKTERIQREVREAGGRTVDGSVSVEEGIRGARVIITVTSAVKSIVKPEWIERGAVICDVSRPRNIAEEVVKARQDVLVIEGGVVDVPGNPDFGMDFGYPRGKSYACMAETMALVLEERYEDYTLGKEVVVEKVEEIERIAGRHGFRVSGLRGFGKELSDEEIERIRKAY